LHIHHPKVVAGRLRGVYWRRPYVKARFKPKFSKSRRRSTKNLRFLVKMGSKM